MQKIYEMKKKDNYIQKNLNFNKIHELFYSNKLLCRCYIVIFLLLIIIIKILLLDVLKGKRERERIAQFL